jgi:hypothetical protein
MKTLGPFIHLGNPKVRIKIGATVTWEELKESRAMPSRFVVQPNGLLARFSTVVDDFTHLNMTEDEARAVVARGYAEEAARDAEESIARAKSNPGRWLEAVGIVEQVYGPEVAKRRVAESEA